MQTFAPLLRSCALLALFTGSSGQSVPAGTLDVSVRVVWPLSMIVAVSSLINYDYGPLSVLCRQELLVEFREFREMSQDRDVEFREFREMSQARDLKLEARDLKLEEVMIELVEVRLDLELLRTQPSPPDAAPPYVK